MFSGARKSILKLGGNFYEKTRCLFLSLLFSTALVTGCTTSNNGNQGGNDPGGDPVNPGGETGNDELPYSIEEVKNKLLQLGQTQGFEITLKGEATSTQGDASSGQVTVGLVRDVFWIKESGAYKKVDDGVEVYSYEENQYVYEETTNLMDFNQTVSTVTVSFYYAYEYVKNAQVTLKKVSNITFLNRSAYQYEASMVAAGVAAASFTVVIDAATGITLKFAAKAVAGAESGEGYIEVTSFKVGNEVNVPELVKKSNPGPGPVDPENKLPKAGTYPQDKSLSQNLSLYKDGAIIIHKDGTGIFVDYADYLGEKHYFTGSFLLDNDDNIVMTTVLSNIESGGEVKISTPTGGSIFIFEKIAEDTYAITLDTEYCVYKLDESSTIEPITEGFLMTKSQYTSIITNMDYLDHDQSATFLKKQYRGADLEYTTTFKSGEGNYQEVIENNLYLTSTGYYYEAVNDQPGYYEKYSYSADNDKWIKEDAVKYEESNDDHSYFGKSAGLYYLSLLPFEELSEPSGANTFYRCRSYKCNDEVTLTEVSIMFVNGELYKADYVLNNLYKYTVDVSDVSNTVILMPEEPEEYPEDCASLLSGEEGSTFVFDKIVNNGFEQDQIDEMLNMYENQSYSFFTDKSLEFHNEYLEMKYVGLGEFNAYKKPSDNIAEVELKIHELYVSGMKLDDYKEDVEIYQFDVEKQELHFAMKGSNESGNPISADIVFKNAEIVPEHYEVPTEPVYPSDAIAAYLKEQGLENERVPELKVQGSSSYAFYDAGALIIQLGSSMTQSEAVEELAKILTNAGFKKYVIPVQEEEYDVIYVSRSNRLSLRFDISNDDNTVMVLFMTYEEEYPFEGYTTYPKDEIDKTYPLGVRDVLPEFSYQGVTYQLDTSGDYVSLFITPQEDQGAQEIYDALVRALSTAGYIPNENNVFISPNGEIEITIDMLYGGESITVDINFVYEVIDCEYKVIAYNDYHWTKDDAQLKVYVWNIKGEGQWLDLHETVEDEYVFYCDSTWIGCKIVRFDSDSEIGWGNGDPSIRIWNQSDDFELDGKAESSLYVTLH